MSEKHWSEIREAANDCLFSCLNSETPLAQLHHFVLRLEQRNWDAPSIQEVEELVLDTLDLMKHSERQLVAR